MAEYPKGRMSPSERELLLEHPPLSAEQLQLLWRCPVKGVIAAFPDKPKKWIRLYKRLADAKKPTTLMVSEHLAESKQGKTVRELRALNKGLQNNLESAQEQLRAWEHLDEDRPSYAAGMVLKHARQAKSQDWCEALVLWSDHHPGKLITRAETEGRNEYTPEIYKQRLARIARKAASQILEINSMRRPVKRCWILCLGDLIENELRVEAAATNTIGSPVEEVVFAAECLTAAIEYVRGKMWKKGIETVVHFNHGNHDRLATAKKPEWSRLKLTSFSYLLARMIASNFEGVSGIRVGWAEGYATTHQIAGHAIRTHHGNGFSYGGGVGGLTIPFLKWIMRSNTDLKKQPLLDLCGHYHHYVPGQLFVANASLCGPDAYTLARGFPAYPAEQALLFVDSKYGRSWSISLRAEE